MIGDPDSMALDQAGELVLDNRSDLSLYVVQAPGVTNAVLEGSADAVRIAGSGQRYDFHHVGNDWRGVNRRHHFHYRYERQDDLHD